MHVFASKMRFTSTSTVQESVICPLPLDNSASYSAASREGRVTTVIGIKDAQNRAQAGRQDCGRYPGWGGT